ncbi:head-tail joining protein [Marinobacter adhaerens]|uniref:Phage protein n=2 Tax=Marinobacter adhaerens TaxID=1033846 RepID=A0ABX8IDQ3_9GAMM|nr:hypothetical protein [Marinobacter adhaerens]ADP97724.1 hypothetical protein HP15_1960 [Marinobacter adhaerens HP15]QWV11783.1 hypothetical protein KQ249_13930 [Marinobacter adhaerens]
MASKFDSVAGRLESAIDEQFAVDAVYTDGQGASFQIRCILDRAVEQRQVYETNMPSFRNQIEIRKSYVDRPRRGDKVTIDGIDWILDGLITDDGQVTRHYANAS